MNNNDLKKYLKRRLSRVQGRFDTVKDYDSSWCTFHGGWKQGYAQGQLSLLEDILDLLEEDEYIAERFTNNDRNILREEPPIRCIDTPPLEPKKVDWLDVNSKTFGVGDNSFNMIDG